MVKTTDKVTILIVQGGKNMNANDLIKKHIILDCLYHTMFKDPPFGDKYVLDLLLEGGVNAVSVSVVDDRYGNTLIDCIKEATLFYVFEETFPNKVLLVNTVKDIHRAKHEDKLAVILSTQGCEAIEHDIRYVKILQKLGFRIMQLTYNTRNNIGCGVSEVVDTGLTRFGQQVIGEMNRVGIVVDLSHVGYKTSMDAIEISDKPCIFSHSSVYALCKHRRNLRDDQIKAAANKGGVIGLCPHSIMIEKEKRCWPTVDDFIDHIIYIMDLVGEDHVGIGTDRWMRQTMMYTIDRACFERTYPGFYGGYDVNHKHVNGFNYYDHWTNLIQHMIKRGLSEKQIKKILSENFLYVFEQVWGE